MELVQSRIVTDAVPRLAAFYAALVRTPVVLNEYYVEVPAGPASVAFSRCRFTEFPGAAAAGRAPRAGEIVLDFLVGDVDAERHRIAALGAEVIQQPVTQPWGNRSMICTDPEGHLINVFSHVWKDH
jgi:predicted enzyme related to lactoylglutathione lyase